MILAKWSALLSSPTQPFQPPLQNDFMSYTKLIIETDQSEILMAFLQTLSFDSFEEKDGQLDAYILEEDFNESVKTGLKDLQNRFPFTYTAEPLPNKNWNELWESNFQPIVIDQFCAVRADFHPKIEEVSYEIIINPKMAFGTGHHETTYMVIQAMESMDFKNKKVFDYGCGTGILAILAAFLGAKTIHAVDIDPPAVENTKENLVDNGVEQVEVKQGTLSKFTDRDYDIILANINRNVILDSLSTLYEQLRKNGTLLVSGFIKKDANLLQINAENCGFVTCNQWQRNNWICMAFTK